MIFRLTRTHVVNKATLGVMVWDGDMRVYTLEDIVRANKIPGETAIPAGEYKLKTTFSPTFNRHLPLVKDVPGFLGIRIHAGNTHHDTRGCILVGCRIEGDTITKSRAALKLLMSYIGSEEHTLVVYNGDVVPV